MADRDPLILWLAQNPQSYFWLAGIVITAALALAVVPFLRGQGADAPRHDWTWGWVILALLVAGRWTTFVLPRELNPDESFMLAGAHALRIDPVFWRAVDGHTSGPLSFLVLWPAGELFGWIGFLPTRLTSLGLLTITFTLLHQCLALITGRQVARLVLLGAVVCEALTNSVGLLHYSTELLPMALLTGATYAAIRRWSQPDGGGWNFLGGLLLGAVPLTKLQAAPLAAVAGLGWLAAELVAARGRGYRAPLLLVGGALLPGALVGGQIAFTGEWANVLIPYLQYNLGYSGHAGQPMGNVLSSSWRFFVNEDSLLHLWLAGSAVWIVLMLRRQQSPLRPVRLLVLFSAAACGLSLWIILLPHRAFVHYWQFIVVPVTLLTGALTGNMLSAPPNPANRRRRWLVAVCAIGLIEVLLYQRSQRPSRLMTTLAYREIAPASAFSAMVARHSRPGESLAIWGWSSYVYVEAGLRQAVRDANCERVIEDTPYRQFYRDRYLADIQRARPEWFLDSIGPASVLYGDRQYAHERNFPELAEFIRANYVQVAEVEEARLYRRQDLAGR